MEPLSAPPKAKGRQAGRLGQGLADDASMSEYHDGLIGMPFGDSHQRVAHPAGELPGRLGARDHIPAFFGHEPLGHGMAFGDPNPEQTAFPLAEVDLP